MIAKSRLITNHPQKIIIYIFSVEIAIKDKIEL